MSRRSVTLEVVGPMRGRTFTFRTYEFVNGRVTVEGSPEILKTTLTYLERTQQAYPVGSAELKAAREAIHGNCEVHPDAGRGGTVEVPPRVQEVPEPPQAQTPVIVPGDDPGKAGGAAGLPNGAGSGRAQEAVTVKSKAHSSIDKKPKF